MVDSSLILRKFAELEEYLEQIREYSGITVSAYAGVWKAQRIVERTLQMMIETCLDIASHVISDKKYRIPENYADTFKVLYENRILETELFETMVNMARFRNIVVHHYDRIDPAIVVTVLNKHLDIFETYQNAIITVLKNSPDNSKAEEFGLGS